MTCNKNIKVKIVAALRQIGTDKCSEKADSLEHSSLPIQTLNLRSLALNSSNVTSIANCFPQERAGSLNTIKSISFSYNAALGDAGAIALAKLLPKSVCEIGLVNCGIGDTGGIELLNWMKKSTHLNMICIEQNHFSNELRAAFQVFSLNNPHIIIVY